MLCRIAPQSRPQIMTRIIDSRSKCRSTRMLLEMNVKWSRLWSLKKANEEWRSKICISSWEESRLAPLTFNPLSLSKVPSSIKLRCHYKWQLSQTLLHCLKNRMAKNQNKRMQKISQSILDGIWAKVAQDLLIKQIRMLRVTQISTAATLRLNLKSIFVIPIP